MNKQPFSHEPTMIIRRSDDGGSAEPASEQPTTALPVTQPATAFEDEAPTATFPETTGHQAAAEAPTQTIDPERIRAQAAQTEAMAPVDATTPLEVTPLEAQLADVADDDEPIAATTALPAADADDGKPSSSSDDETTQPMISKPEVSLAGTEGTTPPVTSGAATAGTAPQQQTRQQTIPSNTTEQTARQDAGAADRQQQAAWNQQQAAAQGYANEASRNNYPGSGTTAQATAGPGYANYPGWNQYADKPGAPYTPQIEYKKGPSTATIVWGTLLALFAFGGIASTYVFGFSVSPSMWTLMAVAALVVIGLALVIGGISSAIHRRKRGN